MYQHSTYQALSHLIRLMERESELFYIFDYMLSMFRGYLASLVNVHAYASCLTLS